MQVPRNLHIPLSVNFDGVYTCSTCGRRAKLLALQHGPREVGAFPLHSRHFHPHQAHVLEVDAAFDVTNINGLKTHGGNKLDHCTFGAGVVSAEHHCGMKVSIFWVGSVPEIFEAVDLEAAHDVGRGKKLLNNFATAFTTATMGEARSNWIGAVDNGFSVQVKSLDAIGNSGVRAANEYHCCSLDSFRHTNSCKAWSLGECCSCFVRAWIASSEDDMFAQLEELCCKSTSDAAQR